MKIKEEYILQNIAGKWIVIDTNARSVNFNKLLALNETGKLLWEKLEQGADMEALVAALIDGFGVDAETARNDAAAFIRNLKELECIDDET